MRNNKLLLGIAGALLMLVCSFFLAFFTVRDFYVAQSGERVKGIVLSNEDVCNKWNKSVLVGYAQKEFNIRLYGPDCREDEFIPNRPIDLRSDDGFVVLESNRYIFRVCFMILIFILCSLVTILMFKQYRFWKRSLQQIPA
ncbi:MAG: hypothetical protein J7527_14215 [Chitinophagaceae bacterium]|nr:hypothetical protein [Chitinophagaceae bacterium]